jgi:hypothetical protein
MMTAHPMIMMAEVVAAPPPPPSSAVATMELIASKVEVMKVEEEPRVWSVYMQSAMSIASSVLALVTGTPQV